MFKLKSTLSKFLEIDQLVKLHIIFDTNDFTHFLNLMQIIEFLVNLIVLLFKY